MSYYRQDSTRCYVSVIARFISRETPATHLLRVTKMETLSPRRGILRFLHNKSPNIFPKQNLQKKKGRRFRTDITNNCRDKKVQFLVPKYFPTKMFQKIGRNSYRIHRSTFQNSLTHRKIQILLQNISYKMLK